MAWLANPKDTSVSMVLEKVLRDQLQKYGRVLDFKLDSRQNTLRLELLLKGEQEPLSVFVDEYQLVSDATGTWVVIKRATASRDWITTLLQDFVLSRRIPIPDKYASISKMLL